MMAGASRDLAGNEHAERGFVMSAHTVHELEENEVERRSLTGRLGTILTVPRQLPLSSAPNYVVTGLPSWENEVLRRDSEFIFNKNVRHSQLHST